MILSPVGWIYSIAGGDIIWTIPVGLFLNASGVRGPEWFWMMPVGFFGGWGLMLLPAMVAAQHWFPIQRELGNWTERAVAGMPSSLMGLTRILLVWTRLIAACLVPAAAGLILASLSGLPFYFLPTDWRLR